MYYYPQQVVGGPVQSGPSYPLGYGGYNGSYFSGVNPYGNYNSFNPYYLQQQYEEQKKIYESKVKEQRNIFANLYKISCLNNAPNQQILNNILGIAQQPSRIPGLNTVEQFEYENILKREQNLYHQQVNLEATINSSIPYEMVPDQWYRDQIAYAQYSEQLAQKTPDNIGIEEFFNGGYGADLFQEAKENARRREQQKVQNLFDNNRYNQFMQQFNMNNNANIDDMTIRMPSVVNEQERAARRRAFIEKIMNT